MGRRHAVRQTAGGKLHKPAWPSELLEQTQVVRSAVEALRNTGAAITPDAVAERFTRAPPRQSAGDIAGVGNVGVYQCTCSVRISEDMMNWLNIRHKLAGIPDYRSLVHEQSQYSMTEL